jgi:hypothetical protein
VLQPGVRVRLRRIQRLLPVDCARLGQDGGFHTVDHAEILDESRSLPVKCHLGRALYILLEAQITGEGLGRNQRGFRPLAENVCLDPSAYLLILVALLVDHILDQHALHIDLLALVLR